MLEHGDAIGKVISLKRALVKHSAQRNRFWDSVGCRGWSGPYIFLQMSRIDWSLIDLHDHALPVEQKGGWNCEVPSPVEEIAVDDVIDSRQIFCRKQDGKRKRFLPRHRLRRPQIV